MKKNKKKLHNVQPTGGLQVVASEGYYKNFFQLARLSWLEVIETPYGVKITKKEKNPSMFRNCLDTLQSAPEGAFRVAGFTSTEEGSFGNYPEVEVKIAGRAFWLVNPAGKSFSCNKIIFHGA